VLFLFAHTFDVCKIHRVPSGPHTEWLWSPALRQLSP